jgi:OOP family OmpA-OmpF porin
VAALLEQMLLSVNRSLEYSISPRGLAWRMESIRTGRPFAEIVLLKTLEYRVEQVFLIHKESGLLLGHATLLPGQAENAPVVSAMMNAIQDFVRDSFRVGGELHTFEVGELTVRVEQGPHALLAGVVRGTVPQDIGNQFQDALEVIHLRFREAFQQFQGDASAFEPTHPILERCLETRFKTDQPRQNQRNSRRARRQVPRWPFITLGLLAAAGLGFWWYTNQIDMNRWEAYINRLQSEPGLIVLSQGRTGNRFVVRGLRDPLSASPAALLDGTGVDPARVGASWTPYQALEPRLVLARARAALLTPDTVTLTLKNDVLMARGQASLGWLLRARNLAPTLPGVRELDEQGIVVNNER